MFPTLVTDNHKIGTFQKCDLKSSQPKIGKQTSTNKHGNKHGAGVGRGWGSYNRWNEKGKGIMIF